ncbi:MAG: hypothetical protein V9G19_14150 [Tetrasphaera sp.]
MCLNGTEDHLKIIDLADGTQASVPTPRLTRRLYADDGQRSFLAADRSSFVLDRAGEMVAADDIPSAAVLAIAGSVLVRAADPSEPTGEPLGGPITIARIGSTGN